MTYKEFIDFCKNKNPKHFEIHHIEPLSVGGVDIDDNKVALSVKDHYNAHKLLALEHPYNLKLWQAWWEVYITRKKVRRVKDYVLLRNKLTTLPIIRSEECRRRKSESTRKQMSSLTPEEIKIRGAKISKSNKKVYANPEVRKKVSDSLKKKWKEPEFRSKCLNSFKTRTFTYKHSDEMKIRLSKCKKGRKWFTNGVKNVFCYECPEGFRKGMTRGLHNV